MEQKMIKSLKKLKARYPETIHYTNVKKIKMAKPYGCH